MKYSYLLLLTLFSYASHAAVYYVSTTGNNTNSGSQASPWLTLQSAADRVAAGDTVNVLPGNYAPFHIIRSGTAPNRITFISQNKLGAKIMGNESFGGREAGIHITADYITVEGFDIVSSGTPSASASGERGIRVSGSSADFNQGVTLRSNRVTGAGWVGITTSYANDVVIEYNECSYSVSQHGIYVANSADRPIIRGNILHHNNMAGLHVNGDLPIGPGGPDGVDGIISAALIENNIIYANNSGSCSSAINLDGVDNSIIRNNLIYNEPCQGISNFREDGGGGSNNNKILNNTLVMAPAASHALKFRNGSINGYVRNNILIQQGSNGVALAFDAASITGINSNNNIIIHTGNANNAIEGYSGLAGWQNASGQDANSFAVTGTAANILAQIFINPTFTPATANYSLLANSPAVDAGINVADAVTDIDGYPRPAGVRTDIGAYEYGADVAAMPIPQNVTITKN